MSLPTFIVLKSNFNEKYLGYVPPEEFKDIHQGVPPSRNSFLRFDRDEVSKCTKFEVKPAKIGDGLVHLKSCYNNKYLVRWSDHHWWIVAAADEPEEDQSKWSCTLFKPEYIDQNANTLRFIHLQLGQYASNWPEVPPFDGCLFAGLKDPQKHSRDVFTVIDWKSRPRILNAVVYPLTSNNSVIGRIDFTQQDQNAPVDIEVNMSNILDGLHAVHINTYGDISDGPRKTEPIFGSDICICSPGPDPIGQLQDVEAKNGIVNVQQTSDKISLFDGENSVIGRSVVVYAHGTPDIGDAVAWGTIGLSPLN